MAPRTATRKRSTASNTAALDLLAKAHSICTQALNAQTASERYVDAHLAALRAAGAIVAAKLGTPAPRGAWAAVAELAPELSDWSIYFARATTRRQRIESGLWEPSDDEAASFVEASKTFVDLTAAVLGVPLTPASPISQYH
ncbi:SAV_6107 family HEPN domain-containing protein [Dermatophilus congolensis]|uniref:SAV_6107 family HEPN domain-containing protein n=1 Tax=Dermatophilus congolensis TaxID=1863 RepID=UPI001AB00B5E|nr:SAV_6107 family HEPN domain-containing protein [Dermatophilus congolensis]MBO3143019.1 hypothetical protein [Dermatophilus congolensis]MBO3152007.1 hypothetical protein [Dermatophilus congolensis]MBO3160984.1 hypothetical protein [Dermatophilus congolensis]MBO3163292.1 hypothetical protein [Dermatophilus congolensis]MBO3176849.1 hypothetical protein [Dermatophilus congolensis]